MNIVLFDRDGTLIVDPPDERVDHEDKLKLFPDTIEALRYLAEHDFAIVIITNQAGIAEGRMDRADFSRIEAKVLELFAPSGVTVYDTYMCPHGADDGCPCRKPKPTMLLQAAKDLDIDLTNAFMVGDRPSDIMAGVNAGAKTILVETANKPLPAPEATYAAPSLLDAVHYIVAHTR